MERKNKQFKDILKNFIYVGGFKKHFKKVQVIVQCVTDIDIWNNFQENGSVYQVEIWLKLELLEIIWMDIVWKLMQEKFYLEC